MSETLFEWFKIFKILLFIENVIDFMYFRKLKIYSKYNKHIVNNQIVNDKSNDVFFSTKKCALYLKKKMQFCVCFLKMFRPLKGWYVLF